MIPLILLLLCAQVAQPQPSDSCLDRVTLALETCRGLIPAMTPAADEAAAHLVEGGRIWLCGQPALISELSGRAGGLMMIRPLGATPPGPQDVVLSFNDDRYPLVPATSGAQLIVFGDGGSGTIRPTFDSRAAQFGLSPTLANAMTGWVFTGELIAALTRLGKMPVVYESIGAYDGNARIQQFKNGEVAFHEDMKVPPVAPGAIANAFIDRITGMLHRIAREEEEALKQAGAWAKEAHAGGRACYMYSMGHLFPAEVAETEIGTLFKSAVWNAGFRRSAAPDDKYAAGDFIAHIGYQHAPDVLLDRARPAGARVAYVALRGDRDYRADANVLWIDPMWDWPDACVPLEGYDVPLLAASGLVNGAIAWEIYRLAQ